MKVYYARQFKKQFQRLDPKIQEKFFARLQIFQKNQNNSQLRNHPLKGNLAGYRAFSVTGNYRVIYRLVSTDAIKLVAIGTHSQVY